MSDFQSISKLSKRLCISGAILMGLAVACGAMGSHALEGYLEKQQHESAEKRLSSWETGVRYQAFHGLALLALGCITPARGTRARSIAGYLILLGVILFSGCLYLWVLTELKPFVMIVPIGGTLLLIAWVLVVVDLAKLTTRGNSIPAEDN